MKQKRQMKLIPPDRACVGCGDSRIKKDGLTTRGHKMLAVTCLIFRKVPSVKATKRNLRATSRVPICEECFVAALAGGKSKIAGRLCSALWERLTVTYNAMREESAA